MSKRCRRNWQRVLTLIRSSLIWIYTICSDLSVWNFRIITVIIYLFQVKKRNDPPLSLYGQLFWREFFYTAATNNPKFDRMAGNQICVQIPWDKNPEALAKWAEVNFAILGLVIAHNVYLCRLMTKPTKWLCPAKTQISLGICPV